MLYRDCSKCKTSYPDTKEFFTLDKQRRNGLSSQCRKCRNETIYTWRRKNKEKCREYGRKRYQRNKRKEYNRVKQYRRTLRGYVVALVGAAKSRCTNKNNPSYERYKNIKVCFTSEGLYDWLVARNIDPRGLDIHRINNDGHYSLDNIEFLTRSKHTTLHNLRG